MGMMERKTQEKKMLVTEVLKLRNEKIELGALYKKEIQKLNKNNTNNIDQLKELNEQQIKNKDLEHSVELKSLNEKYGELDTLYTNYKETMMDKLVNIDSITNGFETMIKNANFGNLSEAECNKILDNIINSIESMELEKKNKEENEKDILHGIECRMLRSLREKALLQRSTNHLMFQLQDLQKQHEIEVKEKDETIKRHEIRAK